jgi:Cdc6-like AAA superfamily ATPase
MSTKVVQAEIAKFLAREMPEALCIRGKWGVGKTFAWTNALKQAQEAKRVALKSYSRRLLSAVFQFDRIVNATAPMREISDRARAALREIGAESDINRRRVKRYGINFDEPGGPAEDQPSEPDATEKDS